MCGIVCGHGEAPLPNHCHAFQILHTSELCLHLRSVGGSVALGCSEYFDPSAERTVFLSAQHEPVLQDRAIKLQGLEEAVGL